MDDRTHFEKTRLETARLLILRALYAARPIEAGETIVLRILNDFHFNYTLDDVRRELDYLRALGLAEAGQDEGLGWWARPTALGVRSGRTQRASSCGGRTRDQLSTLTLSHQGTHKRRT